jgi:TolA-binding protein
MDHEDAGHWARNVFIVIALLEIVAIGARRKSINVARVALWASAVVGIAGGAAIIKAADRGGDLVYAYAGGVGTRTGDTAAVTRLYLAGLYQAALQARTQKDSVRAASLFSDMERQFPNDTNVRLLVAESQLRDKHDSRGALVTLSRLPAPPGNRFLASRVAFLKADAYVAAGKPDSARATLEQLAVAYPELAERVRGRIAQIK